MKKLSIIFTLFALILVGCNDRSAELSGEYDKLLGESQRLFLHKFIKPG